MVDFLLMVNILIPLLYAFRKGVDRGMVRVNHVVCFSFGFLYYWILPVIFFRYFPDINDLYYRNMLDMFKTISKKELYFYLISVLFIYCAFMAGTSIVGKKSEKKKHVVKTRIFKLKFRMEKICFVIILFICLFAISKNLSFLFRGYLLGTEVALTGMFSASFLMVCSASLLHIIYVSEKKIWRGLKSPWSLLFVGVAILLLSTGGRLYVVSGIIAIICLYTTFYNPMKIKSFVKIAVFGMSAMAVWGYLRLGQSEKSVFEILTSSVFYLVTEPIYTSYSLVKYLSSYHVALLRVPVTLLNNFFNIIPTVIFPNKTNYLVSYEELGYLVSAPLGAMSSFTSFNIDFGLIGSLIFVFSLSGWLNKLQKKDEKVWKVVYAMMCSNLVFTFFRDPFSTSIIKNMFEYSFLIPWIFNFMYKKNSVREQ